MPARRRVSGRQLEVLLDFAEAHPDIALGRLPGGPLSSQAARQSWGTLAASINAVADGTTKTADQWRRYWIELKAKVKNKAADSRRSAHATGGGPNKLMPLSMYEECVLALIETVAVERLPGVRIPLNIPTIMSDSGNPDPMPQASNAASPFIENIMEVEWLEDSPPNSNNIQEMLVAPLTLAESTPNTTNIQHQASVPSSQTEVRRRRMHRDENVPRWAYELEERRLEVEAHHAAAVERIATAIENIERSQAALLEQIASALQLLINNKE